MKLFAKPFRYAVRVSLALAITSSLQAADIVTYDFTTDADPNTEASNTSSSTMDPGSGWGNSGRSSFSLNFFGRGISTTPVTSYVAFTTAADSGYTIDLTQLDFDYHFQQSEGVTSDQVTFEVRSSVDSFASAIPGTYSLNPAGVTAPYENATFNLSGGSYDGLASIEFRLYATNDTEQRFNDIVRWDNITVSGSATSGGGGNTFADWIDGWGLDAADKDFTDDPDGDHLPNGIEAFFGTNPAEPGQGLTQVSKSGNLFSFQHPEADPALSDVTGSYEWSLDLQNWFPQGTVGDTTVTISASKDDPVSGTTTVTADTSGSTTAPTKLFLRVVASQGT